MDNLKVLEEYEDRKITWADTYEYQGVADIKNELEKTLKLLSSTIGHNISLKMTQEMSALIHSNYCHNSVYEDRLEEERKRFKECKDIESCFEELDVGPFGDLPIPSIAMTLSVYAGFGIFFEDQLMDRVEDQIDYINDILHTAKSYTGTIKTSIPFETDDGSKEDNPSAYYGCHRIKDYDIRGLVLASEARLNLDVGRPVSQLGLAELAGGLSLKSIQNAVSNGKMNSPAPGMVDAKSALKWFENRKDCLPSIWKECIKAKGHHVPEEHVDAKQFDDEAVFIPKAKDGSKFFPELKRKKGYLIGLKGHERYFDDYFEALSQLQKMEKASWRRPSASNGVWGLVTAASWERCFKSELIELIELAS